MTQKEYYTAPSDEIFEDIKACALKIWNTYDNTYGYVDEKVRRIKDLKNISDNCAYIVAMFDSVNQSKLFVLANIESKKWLIKLLGN